MWHYGLWGLRMCTCVTCVCVTCPLTWICLRVKYASKGMVYGIYLHMCVCVLRCEWMERRGERARRHAGCVTNLSKYLSVSLTACLSIGSLTVYSSSSPVANSLNSRGDKLNLSQLCPCPPFCLSDLCVCQSSSLSEKVCLLVYLCQQWPIYTEH